MRKFLGLAKPYNDEIPDHHSRFAWSWRPKRYTRRRAKSFAMAQPPPSSSPSVCPNKELLPIKTNPEQVLRLPSSHTSAIDPPYHDKQNFQHGEHPLTIPSDEMHWSERDLKARTWPYQLASNANDHHDHNDQETDPLPPAGIVLTPPADDISPLALDTAPNHESPLPNRRPMEKNRGNSPAITSKNRSGNTIDIMVSSAFTHSNPENGPTSPASHSQSSDYHTPPSTDPNRVYGRHVFKIWPRDTSTDTSFPASINCASKFSFQPPDGRWHPAREYQHCYLVNGSACTGDAQEETVELLRVKLSQAESTIAELKRRVARMEKRSLPSPDVSDDECATKRFNRLPLGMNHGNFSEDIMSTRMKYSHL
ncbi:hypothetical protein Unana1_00184 [Umbelopsis nana]